MHITLHLTTNCNLNCRYCYSPPSPVKNEMSKEIIDKAVEFSQKEFKSNIGIIFFGGEPLLKKELIRYTIGKCKSIEESEQRSLHFHYKITSNGLLIDEEFMEFSRHSGLNMAISVDGIQKAHDCNRVFPDGRGTFKLLDKKIDVLLKHQPYANALMVITPATLRYYSDSVEYLIHRGFRYIIASLNFAGNWTDADLRELEKQYEKIARLYLKWTIEEKKFYFSPFEMKFATHIRGNQTNCYSCKLSKKQISISPDGLIYPCVQFVRDGVSNREFSIGDVWKGFNENRERIFEESIQSKNECKNCALHSRCYNTCSCLNWQTTGNISKVSPFLCESEQILIEVADKLGEELYKRRLPMFIQKHYNTAYPLLSMLEDEFRPHRM